MCIIFRCGNILTTASSLATGCCGGVPCGMIRLKGKGGHILKSSSDGKSKEEVEGV